MLSSLVVSQLECAGQRLPCLLRMLALVLLSCLLAGTAWANTCSSDFNCPQNELGYCVTGNYADPCNCQQYYHCQGCNKYHLQCPYGELFDDESAACQSASSVYCWATTNAMPSTYTAGMSTHTDSPVTPLIMSVGRNQDLSEAQIIMKFEHLYANQGTYFNPITGLMQAPRGTLLYQSFSAGAQPFAPINLNLREASFEWVDLLSTTTNRNGTTTICRNLVFPADRGEYFSINMAPASEVASDPEMRQTSWSAFDYEQIMEPAIAFAAGARNPSNHTGIIMWDHVETNLGGHYNESTGFYTVTDTGLYFISVSIGKAPGHPVRCSCRSNRQGDIFMVNSTGSLDNGIDMAMNAMMLLLLSGEKMFVSDDYGMYYSDFEMQTSWTMILYRPKFTNTIAFTVFSYQDFDDMLSLNPFPFHEAKVNTQYNEIPVYNFSRGHFYAPVDGYYFLYLNAYTWTGKPCKMEIHNDGLFRYDIAGLAWTNIAENGGTTIGRGLILQIRRGEETWVEKPAGYAVRGTDEIGTSWTGFLLYPS